MPPPRVIAPHVLPEFPELVGEYRRRRPQDTVLCRVIQENCRSFVAFFEEEDRPMPAFVQESSDGPVTFQALPPDGRVVLRMKRTGRAGTAWMVFEPLDLLSKLTAMIPRPRMNTLRLARPRVPCAARSRR